MIFDDALYPKSLSMSTDLMLLCLRHAESFGKSSQVGSVCFELSSCFSPIKFGLCKSMSDQLRWKSSVDSRSPLDTSDSDISNNWDVCTADASIGIACKSPMSSIETEINLALFALARAFNAARLMTCSNSRTLPGQLCETVDTELLC